MVAKSIKDKRHIVHETLKLRLRPTKDKKVRKEFLKNLKIYIKSLEKAISN